MKPKNPIASKLEAWERRFHSQPLIAQYRQILLFTAVFFIGCFQILLWQQKSRQGKIKLPNLPADASVDAVVTPLEKSRTIDEELDALFTPEQRLAARRRGARSDRDSVAVVRHLGDSRHSGLPGDSVPALSLEQIRAIKELYRHQHGRP